MDNISADEKYPVYDDKTSYSFKNETIKKPKQLTSKPIIAGIFLVLAGIIAILFWGSIVLSIGTILETMNTPEIKEMYPEIDEVFVQQELQVCGTIGIVLSIFPILGGIFALKRKQWGISIVGGIIGLFTLGFLVISPVLSLIGIILIFISKDEF